MVSDASVVDPSRAASNLAAWPLWLPQPRAGAAGFEVSFERGPVWLTASIRTASARAGLHSRHDPVAEAGGWLDREGAGGASTIFVVGLGLGYILDALERRRWNGRVVALEPDSATLWGLLGRRDWRDWLSGGRLFVLLGPDYAGASRVMADLVPDRQEPVVLVHPVIARLCPDAVAGARDAAGRLWYGARANQEARRRNAGRYLINTLRNLDRVVAEGDVADLTGHAEGAPAIVVAAGPSLDLDLGSIAQAVGRAVIIAVDTAVRPLLAAGVEPDAAVMVDPSELNARHLTELPGTRRCALVAEASVDPVATECFSGRVFFGRVSRHHPWPWLEANGIVRGPLQAWGSVLTTSLGLAVSLGCSPIVMAGADLAYSRNRPYARGTTFEEDWCRQAAWGETLDAIWARAVGTSGSLELEAVDGARVRTAPHLVAFRDWVIEEAGRHPDRLFVNATPGGILAGGGILQRSLADVVAELSPLPPGLRQGLLACHSPMPGAGDTLRAAVAKLAEAAFDPAAPPVAEWLEFAGRSDLRGAIVDVLNPSTRVPRRSTVAVTAVPVGSEGDTGGAIEPPARPDRGPADVLLNTLTGVGIASVRIEAALSHEDRAALAHLVTRRRPRTIVDLGASDGVAGLAALMAAGPDARLWRQPTDEALASAVSALGVADRVGAPGEPPDRADVVIVPLNDPRGDGESLVRQALDCVSVDGVLVVIDEVGKAARARLHRSVYRILEERPDVWILDRRFEDHTSRLLFVFADRMARLPDPEQADARKWDAGYRAAARKLAPVVHAALVPGSVVDMGCGPGDWLVALAELGVADCVGITPSRDGAIPADAARFVRRGPLTDSPVPARRDVCLCLEVIQRVPPAAQDALIAASCAAADTVVFSSTPPGWPGGDPGDRPLAYWAAAFLRHGFVLDDSLRPVLEGRWGFPAHVTEGLVLFRRSAGLECDDAGTASALRRVLLDQVRRTEDLYLQGLWWQVGLMAAARTRSDPPDPPPSQPAPHGPRARLRLAAHRLLPGPGGSRVFRLRTDASRWYVTHGAAQPVLEEDGVPLPRFASNDAATASAHGGWVLWRDELTLCLADGTDPRTNGRVYELVVPAYVAWAERQTFGDALRLEREEAEP